MGEGEGKDARRKEMEGTKRRGRGRERKGSSLVWMGSTGLLHSGATEHLGDPAS